MLKRPDPVYVQAPLKTHKSANGLIEGTTLYITDTSFVRQAGQMRAAWQGAALPVGLHEAGGLCTCTRHPCSLLVT